MRSVLVLIALLLAACEETIVLGTECPSRDGPCAKKQPLPGDRDEAGSITEDGRDSGEVVNPSLDGGVDPGLLDSGAADSGRSPRDASVIQPPDARPREDAGPALFPAFRNPSFELVDGGQEGELDFTPTGPGPGGQVETSIAPWYPCRKGFSVKASAMYGFPNQTTVTKRDGQTFLTDSFPIVIKNYNGLMQELAEPMLPDRHYAFLVDIFVQPPIAISATPVQYSFELQDGDLGCLAPRKLVASDPLTPGEWTTVCMNFMTPPESPLQQPIRNVMITANSNFDSLTLMAEMNIDNIRYDPACANKPPSPSP